MSSAFAIIFRREAIFPMQKLPLRARLGAARRRAAAEDPAALRDLFSPFLDPKIPPDLSFRERFFPPLVTFWLFLHQSLSSAMSCREAVLRLGAERLAAGLEAAAKSGLDPARISLAAAAQVLRQSAPWLRRHRRHSAEQLLSLLAACETPDRPDRHSPRAVKRRHNKYPLLTKPRDQFNEIKHRSLYSTKTK